MTKNFGARFVGMRLAARGRDFSPSAHHKPNKSRSPKTNVYPNERSIESAVSNERSLKSAGTEKQTFTICRAAQFLQYNLGRVPDRQH